MALGLQILSIALLDELILLLRGETPHYLKHDSADAELEKEVA